MEVQQFCRGVEHSALQYVSEKYTDYYHPVDVWSTDFMHARSLWIRKIPVQGQGFSVPGCVGNNDDSWEVTMIPQYMLFNVLGWINTLKALIVPSFFGSAYFIFLLRQFILTIPRELDEAATIDGANKLTVLTRIIVPLMGPSLILVAVFQVMGCWNDYLGPLIFLNDQTKYTLTLGLSQFKGMYGVDMQSIMAITVLISIPPLAIFFFAQRYIVGGIATTGIKG